METPEYDTIIDPSLRFFEEFFLKGGFHNQRENFFIAQYWDADGDWHTIGTNTVSVEEEWREMIGYRIIPSADPRYEQDEEEFFYKEYFSDLLLKELDDCTRYSKKLIRKKIALFEFNQEKIVTFLKVVLNDLVYIINFVKKKPEISKYRHNIETLYQFVIYLFKRYNAFLLATEFPIHKEAEEFLQSKQMDSALQIKEENVSEHKEEIPPPENSVEIKGFNWKYNKETNTRILYFFLTQNEIISKDTSPESFEDAFNGEVIAKPLKIKWLLKTKRGHIKPVILKVINLLMFDLKLLEKISVQLHRAKTIEAIFCDPGGQAIKKTEVSISQGKNTKNKIKDMVVDEFIEKLRKVQSSVNTTENQ